MASLTPEIIATLTITGLAFFLFLYNKFSVDINALIVLLCLGITSQLPFLKPLLPGGTLFSGFSSTAIIAIIALMILAAGIEKTGGMNTLAKIIAKISKGNSNLTIALYCLIAGLISAFIQNIAVVALCLPVAVYLSKQCNISLKSLLMPMGFCVILGGNITLIGNGSLIVMDDFIKIQSEIISATPITQDLHLFSVMPIGAALLICGVFAFTKFNQQLFNNPPQTSSNQTHSLIEQFDCEECTITFDTNSPWIGKTIADFEAASQLQAIAIQLPDRPVYLTPFRSTLIAGNTQLALAGPKDVLQHFLSTQEFGPQPVSQMFAKTIEEQQAGYSEIVLTSLSTFVGQSLQTLYFRKNHGCTTIAIQRGAETLFGESINQTTLLSGDILLVFSPQEAIKDITDKQTVAIIHSECSNLHVKQDQSSLAIGIFVVSLLLAVTSVLPLNLCLWLGVLGMFTLGIINSEEAYQAVSWKTVILLASLIPLGIAMSHTGTADWLSQTLLLETSSSPLSLQFLLAGLTTLLTLIMSNVGATVLLLPIAMSIAQQLNTDPLLWLFIVGITSSNSFLVPTHQANALIMTAGKYEVREFLKVGTATTIAYVVIELLVLNILF